MRYDIKVMRDYLQAIKKMAVVVVFLVYPTTFVVRSERATAYAMMNGNDLYHQLCPSSLTCDVHVETHKSGYPLISR
jgi:intracellular sulfur oxidation DsrE/DsrF family protein